MDELAERIGSVLGSAIVIGGFGLWCIVHAIITKSYVDTISDFAIEIGFLILRAENVQAGRQENHIKEIKRKVSKP